MSFISTLKPMELSMLRGIVRKTEFAYVEAKHGKAFVTDYEVDKLIVGVRADICDTCVDVCNGIIKEGSDFGTTAMWINRIKDKRKIKTY